MERERETLGAMLTNRLDTSYTGRFPFTKKFGNFLLGISVWEKCVPFVTSPILGRPGRLIDRERHGTGDKDNKSVNGTQIFHWEVSTGKTETGIPFIPENFQWKEPKSRVPFATRPEFPEFFGKWKTLTDTCVVS